jgi:hypothetical protein
MLKFSKKSNHFAVIALLGFFFLTSCTKEETSNTGTSSQSSNTSREEMYLPFITNGNTGCNFAVYQGACQVGTLTYGGSGNHIHWINSTGINVVGTTVGVPGSTTFTFSTGTTYKIYPIIGPGVSKSYLQVNFNSGFIWAMRLAIYNNSTGAWSSIASSSYGTFSVHSFTSLPPSCE